MCALCIYNRTRVANTTYNNVLFRGSAARAGEHIFSPPVDNIHFCLLGASRRTVVVLGSFYPISRNSWHARTHMRRVQKNRTNGRERIATAGRRSVLLYGSSRSQIIKYIIIIYAVRVRNTCLPWKNIAIYYNIIMSVRPSFVMPLHATFRRNINFFFFSKTFKIFRSG